MLTAVWAHRAGYLFTSDEACLLDTPAARARTMSLYTEAEVFQALVFRAAGPALQVGRQIRVFALWGTVWRWVSSH
eukprot:9493640-Lingulodinium_polyedra.AAC.1